MADPVKVGVFIDGKQKKDAIHIAIAPVIAGERLYRGQHIGFVSGSTELVKSGDTINKPIGIVDPFLENKAIGVGTRFWMWLYPNTITSLRHDWTHPDFTDDMSPEEVDRKSKPPLKPPATMTQIIAARQWLQNFANEVELSYEDLIREAGRHLSDKNHYVTLNFDTPDITYDEIETFWANYEIVTGVKAGDPSSTFFSCSC